MLDLNPAGVTLRGLELSAFDDWLNQVAAEEPLGLATTFYPLHRVERIALDEPVGDIPSLANTFSQKIGLTLLQYLDRISAHDSGTEMPS